MANLVIDDTGLNIGTPFNKRILRTSDGTIHVIVLKDQDIRHYYSQDNGQTWNYATVFNWYPNNASLAKDSNDNLYIAAILGLSGSHQYGLFKATITKGNPWTWSWGSYKFIGLKNENEIDITIDGNNYIHIVVGIISGTVIKWARSVDGGANFTVIDISTVCYYPSPSIVHDSSNNLFVFYNQLYGEYVSARKITYNGGMSWTVGDEVRVYGIDDTYPLALHILPDNRIITVFKHFFGAKELWFKKSTNPSDITAWNNEVILSSNGLTSQFFSICAVDSSIIFVYYHNPSGQLVYRKTIDSGINWENETVVVDDATSNGVNVVRECSNRVEYIYKLGTTSQVYQNSFFLSSLFQSLSIYPWIVIESVESGKGLNLSDQFNRIWNQFRTLNEILPFLEFFSYFHIKWLVLLLSNIFDLVDQTSFHLDFHRFEQIKFLGKGYRGYSFIVYLTFKKINGVKKTFKRVYDVFIHGKREKDNYD